MGGPLGKRLLIEGRQEDIETVFAVVFVGFDVCLHSHSRYV